MKKLHICRVCTPHHYDNCDKCWGFGVVKYKDDYRPVSAHEADLVRDSHTKYHNIEDCPLCGSNIFGVKEDL